MKYFIFLIVFIGLSCTPSKKHAKKITDNEKMFRILKIDSYPKGYVIYAKKDKLIYKIISRIDTPRNCINIVKGGAYPLRIVSCFDSASKQPPYVPLNHLGGTHLGDVRVTFDEDSIVHDLFYSENLKGLCYIKDTAK